MSPVAGQNGPNSKINNFVLKLSVSGHVAYSNHRNPPKEWDQKLTYCESGFEPSVLQTLMYDIPLLSNLIVLHPLIYVLFHSSCWHQIVTGRREAIRKLDIRVYYLKLNAIKPYCLCKLSYLPTHYKFSVKLILLS